MKKNLLSLVAILAAAGLCLSSCNKNNPDDPTPTPVVETADMELVVAVDVSQNQYLDQSYEMDVNGKVKSFTLSDMTEITDLTRYAGFTTFVESQYVILERPASYKVYKYDLGTISTGQSVKGIKKYTMKTGRPSTAEFDVLDSYTLATKALGPVGNVHTSTVGGLQNTDEAISELCEVYSGDMNVTYSL